MKIKELHKLRLVAKTPIFVGSGEALKPLSYLIEGDTVHVLSEERFFARLSLQEQQRYLTWIDPLLDRLARLDEQIVQVRNDFERRRQLQRQRREFESELSLRHFLANILKARPMAFVSQCEAYAVRCQVSPERDGFRQHMKDMAYRPYLPGTEIKGALRTAVLYALVADPKNYPWLRDQLAQFRSFFRSGASPREKIRRLEKLAGALEAKFLRGERGGNVQDEAHLDFFRMFQVSDSTPLSPANLRIELTQMLGTRRYTKTWIESIAPRSEVCVQLGLGDPTLILRELGLERLQERLSLPKLLEACFIRSRDILDQEAKQFADQPRLKTLVVDLQRENKRDVPLLRLGQGQGFLGVTVNLPIQQQDGKLYDEAIREGVSFHRRWKTQPGNFPKTRRTIVDHTGTPISILGWVKVVPENMCENR